MKKYSKLRIKASILDIIFIIIIWFFVLMVYILLFKDYTKYDNKVGIALFLSLFLCKDNINGQSLGKRMFKLKVVDYQKKELNPIQLIARNLFVFLAPLEFILILLYGKRLGDKFMKSQVIVIKKRDKITFINIMLYLLVLCITFVIFLLLF